MQDDIAALLRLNEDIGAFEGTGNAEALGGVIAPVLAFRRRDGSFADRGTYLAKVNAGERKITVESIQLYGNRAVVACVVQVTGTLTHNLRLFVKEQHQWRLLGWANESA